MNKDEISNLLFEILQKILYYVPITREDFNIGIDIPLTGDAWDLDAIQMVYLFCEVEKKFKIRIQPRQLINYRFNTIRQITNLIVNYSQQADIKKEASI